MPPEESPRLFVIFVPHEHPHSSRISAIPAAYTSPAKNRGAGNRRSTAAFILLPDDAEKERSRTVHDCYVGEFPVAIVGNQRLDYEGEEGMVRDGAHSVVGDAGGMGAADPGWVGEERVEAAVTSLRGKAMLARVGLGGSCTGLKTMRTYVVEVDIDPAIVREYKVANGICPLYRLGIVVKGV